MSVTIGGDGMTSSEVGGDGLGGKEIPRRVEVKNTVVWISFCRGWRRMGWGCEVKNSEVLAL